LIATLFTTILIEGAIALGYGIWRKDPVHPLLFSSICINLVTQSLLWIVLNIFLHHYLVALFIAEFFIWIMEGFLLHIFAPNRLGFQEALLLSFLMNLASLVLGWFLPL
jgi:hypothetical protein